MIRETPHIYRSVLVIAVCLWACYLIAALQPQPFWGLHHIAFLETGLQFGFLAISLGLICLGFILRGELLTRWNLNLFTTLCISVIMGSVYHAFPFYETLSGDAELFSSKLGERTTAFQSLYLEKLLSLNVFHPKTGNTTVLSGVRLMSFWLDISHREAYRLLGAVSGALCVFIWLRFLKDLKLNGFALLVAGLLGVLMPFTQFFFGYEEIYAPAYPMLMTFLWLQYRSFRTPTIVFLAAQFVLLFLCMKIHAVFVLLIPSFLLSAGRVLLGENTWIKRVFSWKSVLTYILLPILILGMLVYFFVTKSYNDPRSVGPDVNIYERLFLPILSPEAPLDRYSLLSWNHFLDYGNMLFQWFGPALVIILVSVMVLRRQIEWNRPELISIGLSGCLFLMIFFVYNPLMSMPLDYDLFSLPSPVFLAFSVLLFSQIRSERLTSQLGVSVLGLAFLVIPIFQVNANRKPLSFRAESVGTHVFKTYWIRSAGDIGNAIQLLDSDSLLVTERYMAAIHELEPYAVEGNDVEYANLLWQLAKHLRVKMKDYSGALRYHRQVLAYDPLLEANYVGLMEANYLLGNFSEAHHYSKKLVEFRYPTEEKALRIAIECALQAGAMDEAERYCQVFLKKWEDEGILQLATTLKEQDSMRDTQ